MKEKKNELRSLNEELPAFYLDELEQRLETDPLAIAALLNMDSSDSSDECICICNGTIWHNFIIICLPRF